MDYLLLLDKLVVMVAIAVVVVMVPMVRLKNKKNDQRWRMKTINKMILKHQRKVKMKVHQKQMKIRYKNN